jgi:hypothetical protein
VGTWKASCQIFPHAFVQQDLEEGQKAHLMKAPISCRNKLELHIPLLEWDHAG